MVAKLESVLCTLGLGIAQDIVLVCKLARYIQMLLKIARVSILLTNRVLIPKLGMSLLSKMPLTATPNIGVLTHPSANTTSGVVTHGTQSRHYIGDLGDNQGSDI